MQIHGRILWLTYSQTIQQFQSAHARIVSEVGNFVASVTHSEGSLFDFSIGRTQLTNHLVQRWRESQGKLEIIFNIAAQRADFGISGIVDYWSARHMHFNNPLWGSNYLWTR